MNKSLLRAIELHTEFVDGMYAEFRLPAPIYANGIVIKPLLVRGGMDANSVLYINEWLENNQIQFDITVFHESGHHLRKVNLDNSNNDRDKPLDHFLADFSTALFLNKSNRYDYCNHFDEIEIMALELSTKYPGLLRDISRLDTATASSLVLEKLGRKYFYSENE